MAKNDNLGVFNRNTRRAVRDALAVAAKVPKLVMARAYESLVEESPVVTGAYRSEHVLHEFPASEPASLGAPLYESATRSGPEAIVPRDAPVLDPPSVAAARRALLSSEDFSSLAAINERFYAPNVEERHQVYANISLDADARLTQAAAKASRVKVGK